MIADACPIAAQPAMTQGHDSQVLGGSPEHRLDSAFKNTHLPNPPQLPKPEGSIEKIAGGAETTNSLLQRLIGHKAFEPKVVTLAF